MIEFIAFDVAIWSTLISIFVYAANANREEK